MIKMISADHVILNIFMKVHLIVLNFLIEKGFIDKDNIGVQGHKKSKFSHKN